MRLRNKEERSRTPETNQSVSQELPRFIVADGPINSIGAKGGPIGSAICHTSILATPLPIIEVAGLSADAGVDSFETFVLRWPTEHGVNDGGIRGHVLSFGYGPVQIDRLTSSGDGRSQTF